MKPIIGKVNEMTNDSSNKENNIEKGVETPAPRGLPPLGQDLKNYGFRRLSYHRCGAHCPRGASSAAASVQLWAAETKERCRECSWRKQQEYPITPKNHYSSPIDQSSYETHCICATEMGSRGVKSNPKTVSASAIQWKKSLIFISHPSYAQRNSRMATKRHGPRLHLRYVLSRRASLSRLNQQNKTGFFY